MENKPPVIAVAGPTASGKSDLGLKLARCLGGEIVCMDSMQIYRRMDIGTAKPTAQERALVPHHMLDVADPTEAYAVADYAVAAEHVIDQIISRGRLPILVGGTGLYVQSFLYGVRFTEEKAPAGLREQLAEELAQKGGAALYAELQQVDPEAAAVIHPNNQVRVLRALEHYRATGKKLSEQKAASLPPERPYRSLILGLDFPDRAVLYRRIDLRVDKMLDAGLLAEAELVWNNRSRFRTAAQAIGYKEFFPYFEQTASLEACADKLKQASRNYAKRQLTWFRHMDGVVWLDAGAPEVQQCACRTVQEFLSKG
jgi:tRNA dimethylallyltransferase